MSQTASEPARILVVDDEPSMREFLEILLRGEGHEVLSAKDGETALRLIEDEELDLVLTDLKMGKLSGMDVLRAAKARDAAVQVVVMTAFGTTETAVQAMKDGAFDYITKPFKVSELKVQIAKALEVRRLQRENLYLRERLRGREGFGDLVGSSEAMRRVYDLIARVSRTRTTVLVTGESGTGKELVARAIHDSGADAEAPFVAVNCGAIPPTLIESELFGHVKGAFTGAISDRSGVFEAAGAGSLFLDEVSELPLDMQVKLLRVLQDRSVTRIGSTRVRELHCRVMAATNRDLAGLVSKGGFREDLYYRLNVVQIAVPPLRERVEDIPALAEHFLRKYAPEVDVPIHGITHAAMERLMNHRWDGNVRELENAIHRAVALATGEHIDVEALPPSIQAARLDPAATEAELPEAGVDLDAMLDRMERGLLLQALDRARGVRKEAARLLGITFRSLRYRLDKHRIENDSTDD